MSRPWQQVRDELFQSKKSNIIKPITHNQEKYLEAIDNSVVTICTGPPGTGKAQPLHSLIRISGGWKQMGQIRLGDDIVAADGTTTKVTGVFPQGIREVYRITFADGASVECCDEHLWRVHTTEWKGFRVIPLKEIIRLHGLSSYHRCLYIQLATPENPPDLVLPIHPYLLGFLLGDGSLTTTPHISSADEELVRKVDAMVANEGCRLRHLSRYDYSIVSLFPDNLLARKLVSLRLMGTHSDTKFIPEIYLEASHEQRLELLRGLLDTDGTSGKTGSVSYCTVSAQLARQVQYLVWSLGGAAYIGTKKSTFTYKGEKKKGKLAYIIHIRHPKPSTLFYLTRKKNRVTSYQYSDCLRRRIDRIDTIGLMQTQCISIDHPDQLYVSDDFTVTHNTYVACGLAAQALKTKKICKIVISRPLVTCSGKNRSGIGFLPGNVDEKVSPYMRPLTDAFEEFFGPEELQKLILTGVIEMWPLDLMRGASIKGALIICDEAQNADFVQLHMLLTRFGKGSKLVIAGDVSQTDLTGENSLLKVIRLFEPNCHKDIRIVRLTRADIVRHPLIQWIDERLSEMPPESISEVPTCWPVDQTWNYFKCPNCDSEAWYEKEAEEGSSIVSCWSCQTHIELLDEKGELDPFIVGVDEQDEKCYHTFRTPKGK